MTWRLYFVFIFFFKQKTAYEMRISDWSSDVCSSDLFNSAPSGRWHIPLLRRYSVKLQAGQPVVKSSLANQILVRTLFDNLTCIHHQIGRASCRERVCQYV